MEQKNTLKLNTPPTEIDAKFFSYLVFKKIKNISFRKVVINLVIFIVSLFLIFGTYESGNISNLSFLNDLRGIIFSLVFGMSLFNLLISFWMYSFITEVLGQ